MRTTPPSCSAAGRAFAMAAALRWPLWPWHQTQRPRGPAVTCSLPCRRRPRSRCWPCQRRGPQGMHRRTAPPLPPACTRPRARAPAASRLVPDPCRASNPDCRTHRPGGVPWCGGPWSDQRGRASAHTPAAHPPPRSTASMCTPSIRTGSRRSFFARAAQCPRARAGARRAALHTDGRLAAHGGRERAQGPTGSAARLAPFSAPAHSCFARSSCLAPPITQLFWSLWAWRPPFCVVAQTKDRGAARCLGAAQPQRACTRPRAAPAPWAVAARLLPGSPALLRPAREP